MDSFRISTKISTGMKENSFSPSAIKLASCQFCFENISVSARYHLDYSTCHDGSRRETSGRGFVQGLWLEAAVPRVRSLQIYREGDLQRTTKGRLDDWQPILLEGSSTR